MNTAVNNVGGSWGTVLPALLAGEHGVLLVVTASQGSSPGRAGFKMFVTAAGRMHGSIGGGSMEHKLVELARSLMDRAEAFPFLKRQVHREGEARDRSGMICSGEQTVAFFRIGPADGAWIRALVECTDAHGTIGYGQQGIRVIPASTVRATGGDAEVWFSERASSRPTVAVVGGGHVGRALTRTMNLIGFHVVQFDHREGLEMMIANEWAHEKHVVDPARIEEHVPEDPELFVVLVSHGYRTDEQVLRRLIRRRWRYLGMLGSKAKVNAMFTKLRADGFTDAELGRVHAPIGIPINSRTPEEIAVSIAAQIIAVKNAEQA